jgi:tetratricopeptide (TPR) repeat protein
MEDADRLAGDHILVEAVREQRVALFLGAGASRGALDDSGNDIPDAAALGAAIADAFLDGQYRSSDFRTIYDFACSHKGGRQVQEFVRNSLLGFQPAAHHILIPTFPWVAIFTTNYDLVIERAYKAQKEAVQSIKALASDEEAKQYVGSDKDLTYVKLHGCITQYNSVTPPLIASTEQIIRSRGGRSGLFDRFLEIAKNYNCLFVGYSFQDFNLRTLVDELVKDGDSRPPHFILNKTIPDIEANYWRDRRFRPIRGTFASFLANLNDKCPPATRKLAALASQLRVSTFTRWIGVKGGKESERLSRYIANQCPVITSDIDPSQAEPSVFYRGGSDTWSFLNADLDVRRRLLLPIINKHVLAQAAHATPKVILIKSPAGSGRSVFLKRLAWETAITHDRLSVYAAPGAVIDQDIFAEMFRLTKSSMYLFIDDVAERTAAVDNLLSAARASKWPLTVFLAERNNEWNTNCDDLLGGYVTADYELDRLDIPEIENLIARLDKHRCLGELARLSPGDRAKAFTTTYGGQILVSLHEATQGRKFSDIVLDEYQNIGNDKARLLYLDICSLHRFGVQVRAGLVSRVHDIPFERFKTEFLRPLEKIVSSRWDPELNDYVYATRHRIIADLVYRSAIITPDEKLDNLVRLISKLNPSYSYDIDVLSKLVNFNNLLGIGLSIDKGAIIYDIARKQFGDLAHIFHQAACFLMNRAAAVDQLDRASSNLAQALALNPSNRSFSHTEAEIALKRSRLTKSAPEKVASRNHAIAIAKGITAKSRTPHPFHTIAKARIDILEEALEEQGRGDDPALDILVSDSIKQAQQDIGHGLKAFSYDPRLLASQSDLYRLLTKNEAALKALEKAFQFSPQSVLAARRLAAAYEATDDFDRANDVLRKCIEFNVHNHDLHLQIAMNYTRKADGVIDADVLQSANFHFARGLTTGDRRWNERFWYARGLFLIGDGVTSRAQFSMLKEAPLAITHKREVRGAARAKSGPTSYIGDVIRVTETYAFISCKDLADNIFVHLAEVPCDRLTPHDIVTFNLAFTYWGPIAQDIQTSLL